MDWQQILSLIIVAVTGVLLVRTEVRKRHRARETACHGECGCVPSGSVSTRLERIKKDGR